MVVSEGGKWGVINIVNEKNGVEIKWLKKNIFIKERWQSL